MLVCILILRNAHFCLVIRRCLTTQSAAFTDTTFGDSLCGFKIPTCCDNGIKFSG